MINTQNETTKTLEDLAYVRFPIKMLSQEWASNADVVIYAFMLNRFSFFKGMNKGYFENIKDIAQGSRQDESTVKRAIKKLSEHGYIRISKVKVGVGVSNNYTVMDVHSVMISPVLTAPVLKERKTGDSEDDVPW